MLKRLFLALSMVLLLLVLVAPAAYALQVDEQLPSELSDLILPTGLGTVVMVIVGLLKRLNSEKHGKVGRFGDWLNAGGLNQFLISLVVAGIVLGVVQAIIYFGAYEQAQSFWSNFVIAWGVSQVFYNTQKAGAAGIRSLRS